MKTVADTDTDSDTDANGLQTHFVGVGVGQCEHSITVIILLCNVNHCLNHIGLEATLHLEWQFHSILI